MKPGKISRAILMFFFPLSLPELWLSPSFVLYLTPQFIGVKVAGCNDNE